MLLVVRIVANAADLANIKIANNPQDFFTVKIESKDSQPNLFIHENHNSERLKATTQALMKL